MAKNTNSDTRLWERRPKETERAFAWFIIYRDMSPIDRSVAECYRRKTGKLTLAKCPSWIYELSTKWDWRSRVVAFDQYMDRLQFESEVNERIRARKLRRGVLLRSMKAAGDALPGIDFAKASVGEIARLLDVTSKNLREEYADVPVQRQTVTVVNGGSSEHVTLAERSDQLTDSELVAEYRRMTSSTVVLELTDGADEATD